MKKRSELKEELLKNKGKYQYAFIVIDNMKNVSIQYIEKDPIDFFNKIQEESDLQIIEIYNLNRDIENQVNENIAWHDDFLYKI